MSLSCCELLARVRRFIPCCELLALALPCLALFWCCRVIACGDLRLHIRSERSNRWPLGGSYKATRHRAQQLRRVGVARGDVEGLRSSHDRAPGSDGRLQSKATKAKPGRGVHLAFLSLLNSLYITPKSGF